MLAAYASDLVTGRSSLEGGSAVPFGRGGPAAAASRGTAGPLLSVRDIHRSFAGVKAVDGVSLDVEPGRIVGLIGPNGAGKSTLFNVIAGTLGPDRGAVVLDGRDITRLRSDQRARAGLIRTFQLARGLPDLSVLENLMLYAAEQPGEGLWRAIVRPGVVARRERAVLDRAWEVVATLKLDRVANHLATDLSGGQKKLLDLGRVLMARPKIVLLDEPMAGVNPSLARDLAAHLTAMNAAGITILVIEHNMGFISEICHHVYVLANGRNLADGTFASIRADREVQDAYLGSRG